MNIKKIAAIIASALVVMVLVGCSNVTQGTIVNKEFTASYTTHGTICTGSKPMICSPTNQFHDDEWEFELSTKNEKHELITGWVEVTEAMYNGLEEGDYYDAERNKD